MSRPRIPRPGPRESLRMLPDMLRRPYVVLPGLHQRHGPVVQVGQGPFRYVFVFGRDANELVLSGATDSFMWRDALAALIPIDGDTALVVSDGEDHARRRRLVQPAFGVRRIDGYLPIVVDEISSEVGSWEPGTTVDVYAALRPRILNVVVRALFGDALRARSEELCDLLQVGIDYVNRSPALRFDHEWPGTPYRAAMRARRAADDIIYEEIARRREAGGASSSTDLLDALIEARDDEGGAGLTDEELRDQVVSLIAAGYDTTSAGVGWTLHEVHRDRAVRDTVRAEVDDVVGDAALTPGHLTAMPYLDAVVSESLRLHPPGAFSARKAVVDVPFAGHVIPAGSLVVYSGYETHRDADLWPEPERFAPERWLPGSPLHRPADPYAFVPFGGGYRRCIGFALATQEMKVAVVETVRRVELRPVDQVLDPTGIATMSPRQGVRCAVG